MSKKINYIFCINTGRAGSHYLSSVFNHIDNAVSEHEMKPIGHSQEMRDFLVGKTDPMQKLAKERLELIKKKCINGQTFIETSHLFIKGYGWYFAETIPNDEIGIIILHREKNKVIESLKRIGCVPLDNRGYNWINTPEMKYPLTVPPSLPLLSAQTSFKLLRKSNLLAKKFIALLNKQKDNGTSNLGFFSKYNRAALEWYYDETFAQANKFKKKFPNIRFYDAHLEDLNDLDKLNELLDYFDLKTSINLAEIIGKPTNLKKQ